MSDAVSYTVRSDHGDTPFTAYAAATTFACRQSELLTGPFRVVRLPDEVGVVTYTDGALDIRQRKDAA